MISAEFVVDDGPGLPVPEHRDAGPAAIAGLGLGIELIQVLVAVQPVAGRGGAFLELPAVLGHVPVHGRDPDRVLEAFELAHDQRAVRPRAGERDVEVVAPGLGLEPARAGRSRATVVRDPVAELGVDAHEAAVLAALVLIAPDALDQHAHGQSSPCSPAPRAPLVGNARRLLNSPTNSHLIAKYTRLLR